MRVVEAVEDPLVEQYLSRQCVENCLALRRVRGELFTKPRSKDNPHQVLDELDVMLSKGEISPQLFKAGRLYGDRYREAHLRGVLRSSIRLNNRSSIGSVHEDITLARLDVLAKLSRDKRRALGNDRRVIALCDAILGDDYRISPGPGREQGVAVLSWALKRLAQHYGIWFW